MKRNCINYITDKENPKCEDIHFPHFDDPDNFDIDEFSKFIYEPNTNQGKYNNENFRFTEEDLKVTKKGFKLQPQQKFVPKYANFHTNFEGLLIFHNLGSGKTCTSIIIGEAYKAYHNEKKLNLKKDNRVLVVLPPATVEQFKEELIGKFEDNIYKGCVSSNIKFKGKEINYLKEVESNRDMISDIQSALPDKMESAVVGLINRITRRKITREEIRKNAEMMVKQFWDITTHIKFINELVNRIDDNQIGKYTKKLQRGGNLIIIDEIQNLISESGILYKKLLNTIRLFSHKNKFVVLSATPIYDKPFEIGLTLNILNPRINFPITQYDFNSLFIHNNEILKNKSLFAKMITGYVSYFSGGNPNNFPFKRIIEIHHTMGQKQFEGYIGALISEVKSPRRNTKEQEIDEKMSQSYMSRARAYCNIVYDESIKSQSGKIKNMKLQLKEVSKNSPNDKTKIIIDNVKINYSAKIGYIIEHITKTKKGTILIFSDLVKYGVEPIAEILSLIGYKYIDDSQLKPGITKLKGEDYKRFTVWSSEKIRPNRKPLYSKEIRRIFNSDNNKDGKDLKIILGTTSIMEGISFYNVKDVHILNPWWNESRTQQVIARAVRFKSHISLPPSKRFVNVYKHYSILPSFPKSSIRDISAIVYTRTTDDDRRQRILDAINERGLSIASIDQHIGRRSYEKKKQSREFEILLKSFAVDCYLNKEANLTRLVEHFTPDYSNKGNWILFYENPSNGKTYFKEEKIISKDLLVKMCKKITYLDEDKPIFKECERYNPEIYQGNSSRVSYFSYREKENGENLENFSNEYIIKEDIKCYSYEDQVEDDFQQNQTYITLYDQTKKIKVNSPIISEVLFPPHVKFLDPRREEIKLINSVTKKLKDNKKFTDWLMKDKNFSNEKQNRISDIIFKNTENYDKSMLKYVMCEDELTNYDIQKIKENKDLSTEEIIDIIDNAKQLYIMLEGLTLRELNRIDK